jgi:hypothetical protein
MSPAVKYTLGRLGLFVLLFAVMLQFPLNFLVSAMIALLASAGLSYFVLAKWRNEMAEQLGSMASRRSAEKQRLRAALAGDEDAAAAGDRARADRGPADPAETATDRAAVARAATDGAAATDDIGAGRAATDGAAAGRATATDRPADGAAPADRAAGRPGATERAAVDRAPADAEGSDPRE